jgi:eukaryotic-like serine/threonine-protein kinase
VDPFDLVGDMLDGEFRVEEVVGEGALSVVYRAENVTMGLPACVKCLNLPTTLDPAFASTIVASFEAGAKLHYRLARGHLAIAQTFTTGTTVAPRTGAQIHYIVREWFEGESLARDLRRRRAEGEHGRTLDETLDMFDPIASALMYAHSQGNEHLSLMPSNIFVSVKGEDRTLKLLDFGVGRAVDEAASTRSPFATKAPRIKLLLPTYAAPEQLDATLGPTGPWTDVYALALVLLEVLSDRPVMSEKDASALVARALNTSTRPTARAHGVLLPENAERALTRALLLEPESRHSTVAELWKELTVKPRNERRRLATHLRRLRRIRGTHRPPSLRPPPKASFTDEESPTTKVRTVAAMLTARAARASTRPPPLTASRKPPPLKPSTTVSRAPRLAPEPAQQKPVSFAIPPLPPLPTALVDLPKPPSVIVPPEQRAPELEPAKAPLFVPPPVESNSHEMPPTASPLASPVALPKRRGDPRVIAAASLAVLVVVCGIVSVVALARRHPSDPSGPAASSVASTSDVLPSVATLDAPAPPTTPAATATPSTPATAVPPGRFDRRQALNTIKDVTTDLSSCSHKGVWGKGQVGVTFKNDGSVRRVYLSAPFTGDVGSCVREHVSEAHIDPFVGIIGPVYAYFVIPF